MDIIYFILSLNNPAERNLCSSGATEDPSAPRLASCSVISKQNSGFFSSEPSKLFALEPSVTGWPSSNLHCSYSSQYLSWYSQLIIYSKYQFVNPTITWNLVIKLEEIPVSYGVISRIKVECCQFSYWWMGNNIWKFKLFYITRCFVIWVGV